jgi:hypothetical protein
MRRDAYAEGSSLHLSSKDRNLEGLDDMRITISNSRQNRRLRLNRAGNTNTLCNPPPPKTLSPLCIPAKPSPCRDFSFLVHQPLRLLEHDDSVEMFPNADRRKALPFGQKRGTEKTLKLLGDTLTDGGQACFASITSPREHFRHPSGCRGSQGQFPEWKHR